MDEPGELGEEEVQQRLGGQFGDPAAAVGDRLPGAGRPGAAERAPVGRLAELDAGYRQQRAERAVDEVLAEITRVRVGDQRMEYGSPALLMSRDDVLRPG